VAVVAFILCQRDPALTLKVQLQQAFDLDPIPFTLVRAEYGESIPPDVVVSEAYDEDLGNLMRGMQRTIRAAADVANISLGPLPATGGQISPTDPLVIAADSVWHANVLPVVAAGNFGPKPGTLSRLALSPWVLSVGAADASGAVLKSSSRGTAPRSGPDLCADGTDTHPDPAPPGTSFAAPRVSLLAACMFAMIRWLGKGFEIDDSSTLEVETPTVAFLDTGLQSEQILQDIETRRLDALAELGFKKDVDRFEIGATRAKDWCTGVRVALTKAGLLFSVEATPAHVKRLLCATAEPPNPPDDPAAGAGILSEDSMFSFLGSFTPSKFYRCFGESKELTVEHESTLRQLDAEFGSFWTKQHLFFATKALYQAIKRQHVKVYTSRPM
jgi:hypothetical protein